MRDDLDRGVVQLFTEIFPREISANVIQVYNYLLFVQNEVSATRVLHGHEPSLLDDVYAVLHPGDLLQHALCVSQAHAREMIARVVDGEDTRMATNAEIMTVLMERSSIARLPPTQAHLLENLFRQIMPGQLSDSAPRESWPGAAKDLHLGMSVKYARRDRVLPSKSKG